MTAIDLPPAMTAPAVQQVFAALEAAGGAGCVRFVGGCVRDVVMGREAGDIDLCTQLVPDAIEAALRAAGIRHVPTGKAHGTITAIVEGTPYEITALREDVATDGRRAVVRFTPDWGKDAQRRDFYLNALYADIRGQVYDPTGQGWADAAAGRVRFIGDAETRIREDYLRILRFFRFTAGYARQVDAASLEACVRLRAGIDHLSGERIAQELLRLLAVADPVPVCEMMMARGVMTPVCAGLPVQGQILAAVCGLTSDPEVRLAGLLWPDGVAAERLGVLSQRLKLSSRLKLRLKNMSQEIDFQGDESGWVRALYLRGRASTEDGLILYAAVNGWDRAALGAAQARLAAIEVPVFPLRASVLMAAGLAGAELGRQLKRIEARWYDNGFSQDVITQAVDDIRKRTNIG